MAAPDDPSAVDEHGADGYAAFDTPLFSFRNGGAQEVIHGTNLAPHSAGGFSEMLNMALVFLVIGLIAALLGFTTIAGASFAIAKFLALLFLVLFLVFLVVALTAARRVF